jgi:hypothetical protein
VVVLDLRFEHVDPVPAPVGWLVALAAVVVMAGFLVLLLRVSGDARKWARRRRNPE